MKAARKTTSDRLTGPTTMPLRAETHRDSVTEIAFGHDGNP